MYQNSDIEIYQSPNGQSQVAVTLDQYTVWLNQEQLSDLFDRDRIVIGRHIRNLFTEGGLKEDLASADFAHTTHQKIIKI